MTRRGGWERARSNSEPQAAAPANASRRLAPGRYTFDMRHWSELATRNWQGKWARTLGAVLAICLGTAAVVWVSCCYESVRQTVMQWATGYVGNAHIMVSSQLGRASQIPESLRDRIAKIDNVKSLTSTLVQRLRVMPWPASDMDSRERPNDPDDTFTEVDFHGSAPATEHEVRE